MAASALQLFCAIALSFLYLPLKACYGSVISCKKRCMYFCPLVCFTCDLHNSERVEQGWVGEAGLQSNCRPACSSCSGRVCSTLGCSALELQQTGLASSVHSVSQDPSDSACRSRNASEYFLDGRLCLGGLAVLCVGWPSSFVHCHI